LMSFLQKFSRDLQRSNLMLQILTSMLKRSPRCLQDIVRRLNIFPIVVMVARHYRSLARLTCHCTRVQVKSIVPSEKLLLSSRFQLLSFLGACVVGNEENKMHIIRDGKLVDTLLEMVVEPKMRKRALSHLLSLMGVQIDFDALDKVTGLHGSSRSQRAMTNLRTLNQKTGRKQTVPLLFKPKRALQVRLAEPKRPKKSSLHRSLEARDQTSLWSGEACPKRKRLTLPFVILNQTLAVSVTRPQLLCLPKDPGRTMKCSKPHL
jgi:hypothetical protein